MRKLKGVFLILGVAAVSIVPAGPARADFTVGGQSGSAGGCDVILPSATFYSSGTPKSVSAGKVDC